MGNRVVAERIANQDDDPNNEWNLVTMYRHVRARLIQDSKDLAALKPELARLRRVEEAAREVVVWIAKWETDQELPKDRCPGCKLTAALDGRDVHP